MVTALTALAVAAAVAWSVSPLTVTCLAILWLMCRRAVRDLTGRERQWVIGVLTFAVVGRVAVVAVMLLVTNPLREQFYSFSPDGRFAIVRSLIALNEWSGVEIGAFYRLSLFDPYGGRAFYRWLAMLQWFFGPSPFALVLVSVCALIAAALLLYSLVRRRLGARAALVGLVVLLFWPTWFAWSVSMLKEATILLFGALIVWGGVKAVGHERRWFLAAVAIVVSVTSLIALRDGVAVIPVAGTALGLAGALAMRRSVTAIAAIVVCTIALAFAATRPSAQAFVAYQVRAAASRHVGHVASSGYDYRIVDQRFYSGWPEAPWTMQFDEGVRFLVRAAAAFILVPLPWQLPPAQALVFLPVQIAWYLLVALAFSGFWRGIRSAPHLAMVLAGCCVAGLAVIAPNSGNVGTLIRHRDMIVPFLVWLSAAGAARLVEGGRTHGMD
jgi:hypothetical protein